MLIVNFAYDAQRHRLCFTKQGHHHVSKHAKLRLIIKARQICVYSREKEVNAQHEIRLAFS